MVVPLRNTTVAAEERWIIGTRCLVRINGPVAVDATALTMSSSGVSTKSSLSQKPALWMRMSIRSVKPSISARAPASCRSSARSIGKQAMFAAGCVLRIIVSVAPAFSILPAESNRSAPRRAKLIASVRPNSRPAPVIKTFFSGEGRRVFHGHGATTAPSFAL